MAHSVDAKNRQANESDDMSTQKADADMPITLHPVIEGYKPIHTKWIPNWMDVDSYDIDVEKTDHARWAWEFLRRNRYFQQNCEVQLNFDEESIFKCEPLDPEWGLTDFKYYNTEYLPLQGKNGRRALVGPAWSMTQPFNVIDKTFAPKATVGPMRKTRNPRFMSGALADSFKLDNGHVEVIFDLHPGLINPDLLEMQIKNVGTLLREALERYQKGESDGINKERVSFDTKTQSSRLLTILRVADAMAIANGPSREVIGKTLQSEQLVLKNKDPDLDGIEASEFSRAIQPHIKDAYQLIYRQGYLNFLVTK